MSIRLTLTMAIAMVLTLLTASCQTVSPEAMKPPIAVSLAFDGDYGGERFDVSGDPICRPTKISGTVTNGYASLRLHYNNTILSGWIARDGTLRLNNDSFQWDYKFSGKAKGNEIKGNWSVGNAPCRGTWYVKRK